jgi:hypothetical protein
MINNWSVDLYIYNCGFSTLYNQRWTESGTVLTSYSYIVVGDCGFYIVTNFFNWLWVLLTDKRQRDLIEF